jgi:hypothetical protein
LRDNTRTVALLEAADHAVAAHGVLAVRATVERIHATAVAVLAGDRIDDGVAARLVRVAIGRAAITSVEVAVVAHFAGARIDDVVTAAWQLAVRATGRIRGVRVSGARVAYLAEGRIDRAIAAVSEFAVRPASDLAELTLLARREIDDSIPACLVRPTIGRAAVSTDVIAVVAGLASSGDAITAAHAMALGTDAQTVRHIHVDTGIARAEMVATPRLTRAEVTQRSLWARITGPARRHREGRREARASERDENE